MSIPLRGATGLGTYFITSSTFEKKRLLQSERMAKLLIEVLLHYRTQKRYLLHEFVIMPDHFHLLLTPAATVERAMQFIKGGFSFRAKKELGMGGEIWQTSFFERRVRDFREYEKYRVYIRENPVGRGLADTPEGYPFSSAAGDWELDEVPQRLKPLLGQALMQA